MRFRKSVKLGPVRLTAGKKSGSVSIGGPGMRITKSTTGRTTKSVGIPGTGVGWTSSTSAGNQTKPVPAPRYQQEPALPPAELARRRRINGPLLAIVGGLVLVLVILAAVL